MITARTRRQLLVFLLITLLGVSYVGARYAKLGRIFYNSDYQVNAEFAQSGGIFTGAEVTYRGVGVGRVSDMKLTDKGVDVVLSIEKSQRKIPSDVLAQVADKSALGEQYVDLQPQTDHAPYLQNGSRIATPDTEVPVSAAQLLTNLDKLVNSVPQGSLRTTVSELGTAFKGTGPALGRIIDTSNAFIKTADDNFGVTTALIRDGDTVLSTQMAKTSAIRSFARDLSLFSGTLAGSDKDLRSLIDNGSATADELGQFLDDNGVDLGQLINKLVTTGQIVRAHLKGVQTILIAYPYVVAGSYTVVQKGPDGGYDARFGLALQPLPQVCHQGYQTTHRRSAQDLSDVPMNTKAYCAESGTDYRGAAHAPNGRPGAAQRPPVAFYNAATHQVTWAGSGSAGRAGTVVYDGGAQQAAGDDSGSWLLLQTASDLTGATR